MVFIVVEELWFICLQEPHHRLITDLLYQMLIVFLPPLDSFQMLKPVYDGNPLFKHDKILLFRIRIESLMRGLSSHVE